MSNIPAYLADPLGHLLAPLSRADFFENDLDQGPRQIVAADRGRFASLFDWASLDRLLASPAELPPGIRVIANQMNYLFKKEPVNRVQILERLRQGAALVLENVDTLDAELGRWADALSQQLALRIAVNLYFSSPGFQAYPLHYDTHDFFILQIAGSKRWQIYAPTVSEASFQPGSEAARQEAVPLPDLEHSPLIELLLQPGDVLYLPRGYWHQALAEGERSLHLTVGLHRPNGAELLLWLADSLKHDPRFRRSLPWAPLQDWPGQAESGNPWQTAVADLSNVLTQLSQASDLGSRFFQAYVGDLKRRQAYHLPAQLIRTPAELADVEYFEVCRVPHYLVQEAGLLYLIYSHERLRFELAAEPLLREVLSQVAVSRTALLQRFPDLSWAEISAVFVPLIQDGFLVPQST